MNGWLWYGTKNLQVCPLMPGTPVYKDGTLSHLYYKTKEEGKLGLTFHDDEMTHDSFVAYFEKRKTLQVLCEVEENKDLKPVGYSWVDSPVGVDGARAALCGFCFFNGSSERNSARDLARLGLAYFFTDLKIDVVHGILLASNTAAKNFAAKLGFLDSAIVPKWRYVGGELVDIRAMTLEANDFLPSFEEWRKENPVAEKA